MIAVDINLPRKCIDCPMSHWITSGTFEGMLMCLAMEYKDQCDAPADKYIIDEYAETRPGNCPIVNDMIFPNFCPKCGHVLRLCAWSDKDVQ